MKRNWYAAAILLLLAAGIWLAGRYVNRTTAALEQQVKAAYTLAEQGNFPAARQTCEATAAQAEQYSTVLTLLVRRNIIDQLNQTLAILPYCADADSLSDLEIETHRARIQIRQIRQSFFGGL